MAFADPLAFEKEATMTNQTLERARRLQSDGYVLLPRVFGASQVESARASVLSNMTLFRNTRVNPYSAHLAGFHRYPELEPLHCLLTASREASEVLRAASDGARLKSIGLSDITVNRSQEWHTDLLRGTYARHLREADCWGPGGGGVFKALLYLQPGKSLKVIPGAHLAPRDLDSDRAALPRDLEEVVTIDVAAGDLILMDIRLPHRGGTEEELADPAFIANPKILITTVLGAVSMPLTAAMERGNFERLSDWDRRYENSPARAFPKP